MSEHARLEQELEKIIERAYRVSEDVGEEVEALLREGVDSPLPDEEMSYLLERIIVRLRQSPILAAIPSALATIEGDVSELIRTIQANGRAAGQPQNKKVVLLQSYNGIDPHPVKPVPIFHTRPVHMVAGYVHTVDINLWAGNDRLGIHIEQFIHENGRDPEPSEILDIMLGQMELTGIPDNKVDQFKIQDLARSIAINGVRKPPIIDINGDLLDGNRRVAACYYILYSKEFTTEQKKLASNIFVWQLTEHATTDDRRAVVVSLNFEPDNKLDWPPYIKAKRIYEDYQSMVSREPRQPGADRERELKKELSQKYALGPDLSQVNRYLKMVDWALDFKEYHEEQKPEGSQYQIEHHTEKYFEYFDEISKGRDSGVAYALNQNDALKHLVFDLLYDGKFKNWSQIRLLKFYDDDTHKSLLEAHEEKSIERAQDLVEDALNDAKLRRKETRITGVNPRIRTFVSWLEALPISAFRDDIDEENLEGLLRALQLVERQIIDRRQYRQ